MSHAARKNVTSKELTASGRTRAIRNIAREMASCLVDEVSRNLPERVALPYFDGYGQEMEMYGDRGRSLSCELSLSLARWLTFEDDCRGNNAKVNTAATCLRQDALAHMLKCLGTFRRISYDAKSPNIKMEHILLVAIKASTAVYLHLGVLSAALKAFKSYSRRSGVVPFSRESLDEQVLPSVKNAMELWSGDDNQIKEEARAQILLTIKIASSLYVSTTRKEIQTKLLAEYR